MADKVAILVKKASLEFDKLSNPLLAEYDLTVAQYKVLKYLFMHQGEVVRLVDLEKYYSMTHPTTIGLLDTLEAKGYVTRAENPEDRRSKVISLTDKALGQQEVLLNLGDMLEARLTERLTEKERKTLIALLQKLMGLEGD